MTAPRFLAASSALAADRVRLEGPEGHHAAAVRRLRPGERVDLVDGAGTLVEGVVAATGRDWVEVDVRRRRCVPPPQPRLVVAQALAKGERAELAVELLTEVGVDEVLPWAAARSVVQWHGERGERALNRWRATAREAAKQARRDLLPHVAEPLDSAGLAARLGAAAAAVVLTEAATDPLAALAPPAAGEVVLVVGPEGGITDEELAAFAAAGGQPRRLGPTVLRTSTAGAVAAALVLAGTARWGR